MFSLQRDLYKICLVGFLTEDKFTNIRLSYDPKKS